MVRMVKRVPLDFDYPLNKVWYGNFLNEIRTCHSGIGNLDCCDQCKRFAVLKGVAIDESGCPKLDEYFSEVVKQLKALCDVPVGEGYQLWETTSEGSPVSPVFETLDSLCEWCEENYTVYANMKATKEQWKKLLTSEIGSRN